MNKRGIFCIEGEWGPGHRIHSSVQPLVDYVSSNLNWLSELNPDVEFVPSIYRRAATPEELFYLIDWWLGAARYTIGYFAFHGSPGSLQLSDDKKIELPAFFNRLKNRCSGKHIVISSCYMFKDVQEMGFFRKKTGACSISGYFEAADWFNCSALDLLLMTNLLLSDNPLEVERLVNCLCSGLKEKYGFVINC